MDAATLYMVVTLKNGSMRTTAIPFEALELCQQQLHPGDKSLKWCTPNRA